MKKLLLVLLSLAMLFSCNIGSESGSKKEDEKKVTEPEVVTPEEPALISSRNYIEDANGTNLGDVLSVFNDGKGMVVLSPKGYMYELSHNGQIKDLLGTLWYSGLDGSGDMYVFFDPEWHYYMEFTEDNGTYYKISSFDDKGQPKPVSSSVEVNSYSNGDGTYTNQTRTNGGTLCSVVATTKADLGLPENITLPLIIKSSK